MAAGRTILVDVDGTIALRTDRSPFDWHRVGEDLPNMDVITLVQALARDNVIVYVSGRSEVCRRQTEMWIDHHVGVDGELFMREEGDDRQDAKIKKQIFLSAIKDKHDVWLVLDDRDQVVRMWRRLGLTCLQVAPGNF